MLRGRFLKDFSNLPSSSALKALTPGAFLRFLGLQNPPTYLHFLPMSLYSLIVRTQLPCSLRCSKTNSPSRVGKYSSSFLTGLLLSSLLSLLRVGYFLPLGLVLQLSLGDLDFLRRSTEPETLLDLRARPSAEREAFLLDFLSFARAEAFALASSYSSSVQVHEILTFLPLFSEASASAFLSCSSSSTSSSADILPSISASSSSDNS